MAQYAGAIDQGTTSTRFMIFDHGGQVVSIAQKEHEQIYPQAGLGRARPGRDLEPHRGGGRARRCARPASPRTSSRRIGITNQRETTVVWDRNTGEPVYNAIVWQDTRTDEICDRADGRRRPGPLPRRRPACRSRPTSPARRSAGSSTTCDGAADAGRGGRPAVRHHRHLAHLEPHRRRRRRPARHRRHQRQPHAADGPGARSTGTRNCCDAIGVPRAMLPEIRASSEVLRRGRAGPAVRGRPGGRRPRRPAGGAVRPGLLRGRRGQEHLRHRLLPAAQHRHARPCPRKNGLLTTVGYRIGDQPTVLRAGGLHRHHRRAGAVAARQPADDQGRPRDRGAGDAPSRTTAASTSCPRSPACSRRTGAATPAASSSASPATSTAATSPARRWRPPPSRPARCVEAMEADSGVAARSR